MKTFFARLVLLLLPVACTGGALGVLRFYKTGITRLFDIGVLLALSLVFTAVFIWDESSREPEQLKRRKSRRAAYVVGILGRLFVPINVFLYREGLLPLQSVAGVAWVYVSLCLLTVACVLQFIGSHPTVKDYRFAPLIFAGLGLGELIVYVVWIVGA